VLIVISRLITCNYINANGTWFVATETAVGYTNQIMENLIQRINVQYKKPAVVDVRSGDTVRVHQKIREGTKERVQVFQGLVIRTDNKGSHTSRITVRRISSGIGVEKSFLLHSPLVVQIEITKRSKVRRNYLTYMRARTGKAARLTGLEFDRRAVNTLPEVAAEEAPFTEAEVIEASAEPKTPELTSD
jgi:large subunit ribosomal protein L19